MEKKPLVITTYRDRLTHLNCFILYINKYYPELDIAVSEQFDNGPWNKGMLFNAAVKEYGDDYSYFILHDVDFIPVQGKVDYSHCEVPTMIAGEASQFDYRLYYPEFFGGVVVLSKEHYYLVNGFSNQFKGYGGEDDLFYRSFKEKGIIPGVKNGRFECFTHPRPKREDHYRHNVQLLNAGRNYEEGLSTVQYKVVSNGNFKECKHLKIDTTN